jgi:hypothetical protein
MWETVIYGNSEHVSSDNAKISFVPYQPGYIYNRDLNICKTYDMIHYILKEGRCKKVENAEIVHNFGDDFNLVKFFNSKEVFHTFNIRKNKKQILTITWIALDFMRSMNTEKFTELFFNYIKSYQYDVGTVFDLSRMHITSFEYELYEYAKIKSETDTLFKGGNLDVRIENFKRIINKAVVICKSLGCINQKGYELIEVFSNQEQ